jgi:hypothetical protein
LTKYGIDLTTGVSHAANVAAAVLNPKNFKKSLLLLLFEERFFFIS